jgi:hypothetical protein
VVDHYSLRYARITGFKVVVEWRLYAGAPLEYSGCEGSFKDKKEVEASLSRLQELKSNVARKIGLDVMQEARRPS